jgi:hypothetical protein
MYNANDPVQLKTAAIGCRRETLAKVTDTILRCHRISSTSLRIVYEYFPQKIGDQNQVEVGHGGRNMPEAHHTY